MGSEYLTTLLELLDAVERHVEDRRCRVQHSPLGMEAAPSFTTLRDRYNIVCTVFHRIRGTLAGDSNEYLPFYRLPAQLMVDIWDYLPVQDRLSITAVSRHFRSVALDSPRFWKYLNASFGVPQKQFNTLLARAGQTPLHIVARGQKYQAVIRRPRRMAPYTGSVATSSLLAILPRAAVLDAAIYKDEEDMLPDHILSIDSLNMPMPWLRSLRLVQTTFGMRPNLPQLAQQPRISPLFGGYTPALRHLSITYGHLEWSDPIYKHLIYLLIRRPRTRCDFHQLLSIMHSCTHLLFLGLVDALGPDLPSQQGVGLPLLERLFIADSDSSRLSAFLDRVNIPTTVECDFIASDWSIMTKSLSIIGAVREISIAASSSYPYHCSLECRIDEARAIRCHFDTNPHNRVPSTEQQARLYEALKSSYIPFEQVQKLTLSGAFRVQMVSQLFELFPYIKKLQTRGLIFIQAPEHPAIDSVTDIISTKHLSQLQDIEIGPSSVPSFAALSTWLVARTAPASGCAKVMKMLISSRQPLLKASRMTIASIVDNFKWKKVIDINPGLSMTPISTPAPGLMTFPSQANAPGMPEDGESGWDEDEDEEVSTAASKLYERSLLHVPVNDEDDPMLHYCRSSLQTKWNYWALPGF